MKIQEYTINSAKTCKNREVGIDAHMTDLLHHAIGIVTETGELLLSVDIKNNVDNFKVMS